MPARQPVTPATPEVSGTAADLNAATDASLTSHTETPTATVTTGRKARAKREGPKPEHAFLIATHAALAAGVPVETVLPVLAYAKFAKGAAAWAMLTETLTDLTAADDDDAETDDDDDADTE
jgi:hypothetical protein